MTRPEHYRSYSAVFPILLREGANGQEVLLHLRQNTGYMDGCWDFAGSGHVDENETARQAVARECLEELGITVDPADAEFVHLCHRVAGGRWPHLLRSLFRHSEIRRHTRRHGAGEKRRTSLVPHGGPSGKYQYCRGGHAAPLSAGPALQ